MSWVINASSLTSYPWPTLARAARDVKSKDAVAESTPRYDPGERKRPERNTINST